MLGTGREATRFVVAGTIWLFSQIYRSGGNAETFLGDMLAALIDTKCWYCLHYLKVAGSGCASF